MKHKCDGCKYKGEHQEMGLKPFGVCLKETNLLEAEKSYNAERCPFKKTNFDRIKAMSIDEMVDFIFTETDHCDLCSRKKYKSCKDIEGGCKKYIKQYLETEVREE